MRNMSGDWSYAPRTYVENVTLEIFEMNGMALLYIFQQKKYFVVS